MTRLILPIISPVAKSVMFFLLAALVCAGPSGLQDKAETKIKSRRTVQSTSLCDLPQTVPWL